MVLFFTFWRFFLLILSLEDRDKNRQKLYIKTKVVHIILNSIRRYYTRAPNISRWVACILLPHYYAENYTGIMRTTLTRRPVTERVEANDRDTQGRCSEGGVLENNANFIKQNGSRGWRFSLILLEFSPGVMDILSWQLMHFAPHYQVMMHAGSFGEQSRS